jgi:hypothetical protein
MTGLRISDIRGGGYPPDFLRKVFEGNSLSLDSLVWKLSVGLGFFLREIYRVGLVGFVVGDPVFEHLG